MRTLRFIVKDQIIEKDPNCDFSNLVPGTKDYLIAEFTFSPEWNGCVKIASFYSAMGKPYPPHLIKSNGCCVIPAEALEKREFKVRVEGRKPSDGDFKITTNKIAVIQDGGKI